MSDPISNQFSTTRAANNQQKKSQIPQANPNTSTQTQTDMFEVGDYKSELPDLRYSHYKKNWGKIR